jgi:DNA-binding PadR family transcriptional regulator
MFLTMSDSKTPQRSPLGLIVLWQLFQEPMHVYRMQKLIEHQAKDRVVNVRSRANLYQTIERLMRLGLVEVARTASREGYPDRVVYAITEPGREVAREWTREMLRTTGDEFPEFIAAVSVMFGLSPDDAREQLELRAERLAAELAATEQGLAGAPDGLPRLFMLEEEYRMTMLKAELVWLRGVIADLRTRRLDWSEEWLREIAARFTPAEDQHNREDS